MKLQRGKAFRVVVLVSLLLFSSTSFADLKPEIVIGATLPLTGAAATFGNEARMALEQALSDAPKNRYNYRLVIEDDQLQPAKAVAAAKKMQSLDKVKVVFSNWSYGGIAVSSALRGSSVINLAFAWDPAVLKAGSNNFLIAPDPIALGHRAIERCKADRAKKVVLIHLQESGSLYVFGVIKDLLTKEGIEVVDDVELLFDDVSIIKNIWEKVSKKNPDYIFMGLTLPPQLELFKNIQASGKNIHVISIGQSPVDRVLVPYLPVSWWGVDYHASEGALEQIRQRTGLQDLSGYPSYYDGMRHLVTALEEGSFADLNSPTSAEIVKQLESTKLVKGLLGASSFQGHILRSSNVTSTNFGQLLKSSPKL
jgi:ABC-type branched-subunit amino acid transport system substrate-binding protein